MHDESHSERGQNQKAKFIKGPKQNKKTKFVEGPNSKNKKTKYSNLKIELSALTCNLGDKYSIFSTINSLLGS